jgi:Protein of unknown function (DUF1552)
MRNFQMNRLVSRRLVLRGAGVALTLPWLESLLPTKSAQAQAVAGVKRYLPIFLPNGASENWKPAQMGVGAAWSLSPVLDLFSPALKAKMNVLTNFENGSAFNGDGGSSVEPSHGRQPGAFLTCVDPGAIRKANGNVAEANYPSLDQIMAAHAAFKGKTALPSLQLGLSTVESYCDGQPCSNSRSISWAMGASPTLSTTPMYKMVDPLAIFNKIVGVIKPSAGTAPTGPDPEALKRAARNKSIIDAVLENATRTHARLGKTDQMRLDEFLTSVREVEKRVTGVSTGMGGVACAATMKPTMATVMPTGIKQNTATYNKGTHADAINDLIVMAFQCDATRIITHMLEDERSEFTYDHVKMRTFTATGSTEGNGTCPEYHGGGQHGSQDAFASIVRWNTGKVAELATRLDAIKEPDGKSILDHTVIFLAGAMHGSDHSCHDLPVALIGGGALGLKQDQHVAFGKRPLRDLHFTMMNKVFDMGDVKDFGKDLTGAAIKPVTEIIA